MFRVNVIKHGVAGPGRTRSEENKMAGLEDSYDYRGLVIHVMTVDGDFDIRTGWRTPVICKINLFASLLVRGELWRRRYTIRT